MAFRAAQRATLQGLTPTYHAADAAGDEVLARDRPILIVRNGSAAAVTLTVITPGTLPTGPYPDLDVSIPAGAERWIGPLEVGLFGHPTTARAAMTWSATASVTFAVISL